MSQIVNKRRVAEDVSDDGLVKWRRVTTRPPIKLTATVLITRMDSSRIVPLRHNLSTANMVWSDPFPKVIGFMTTIQCDVHIIYNVMLKCHEQSRNYSISQCSKWRHLHEESHSVSNHWQLDVLFNRFFMITWKNIESRVTGLWWPMDTPKKGLITRKASPWHAFIISVTKPKEIKSPARRLITRKTTHHIYITIHNISVFKDTVMELLILFNISKFLSDTKQIWLIITAWRYKPIDVL